MTSASSPASMNAGSSLTTPPCTTGVRWILADTVRYINVSVLKKYQDGIKEIHGNQLSTFAVNTGGQALPTWHEKSWSPASLSSTWGNDTMTNNRRIQPLTGLNNPGRQFYHVTYKTDATSAGKWG